MFSLPRRVPMCEDQRNSRHLFLRLDGAHINVLLPEIRSNILPSRTFLDSLSLENVPTVKRASLIVSLLLDTLSIIFERMAAGYYSGHLGWPQRYSQCKHRCR